MAATHAYFKRLHVVLRQIFSRGLLLSLALLGLQWAAISQAHAQGSPFTCDVVFYQIRNPNNAGFTTVSQIFSYAAINSSTAPTPEYATPPTGRLNALGYNPVDNYMYALDAGAGVPRLYRIGQGGYQLVGDILDTTGAAIAGFTPTAGAFDAAGRYYFSGQGTTNGQGNSMAPNAIFRVDFIPATGNMTAAQRYNFDVPNVMNFGDFDFNGAGGPAGLLLGASTQANYGGIRTMHRITLQPASSGAVGTASVVTTTIASAAFTGIGSAFWDAFSSKFYVFDNDASTFWEILNPVTGSPSAISVTVPAPALPFTSNTNPTDGTSCPISGVRRADLEITKTDPFGTVTTGQVTNYTITVKNNGPYPANYSVIQDPAVVGLQKLSVTCSAPGGPPSAVCPAVLNTSTFESPGLQVITFPPGTSLVFSLNALVTATTATGAVSNAARVTPAIDTTDPTPSNNFATDTNIINVSNTNLVTGAQICPAGTTESLTNRIINGDFANSSPLSSSATVSAPNTLTSPNSVSIQSGQRAYTPATNVNVLQNPFAGDALRSVPGSNSWLLSNGKAPASPNYDIWSQAVGGLTIGRTYEFMYYASNTASGSAASVVPNIQGLINGAALTGGTPTFAAPNSNNEVGIDTWYLRQGSFVAASTTVTLSIRNFNATASNPEIGDLAAIAQIQLRECLPSADVRITKDNGLSFLNTGQTTTYTIVVRNTSTVVANTTTLSDPAVPNFIKSTVACVAGAGSVCPSAPLTVLALEGAGLTIPVVTATSGIMTFTVAGQVTGAPGTTVTNIVTLAAVGYTDSNTSNNQAQDADPVRGSVNLSITKTNTASSLVSGSTTSYDVTVTNTGPSSLVNGIFRDVPTSGLQCTSITCVPTGAALCPNPGTAPGELSIANMSSGGGIVIPSMVPNSALRFSIACNVIARGVP
ncbi:DUF11 domain-containing protein [Variovorax sp. PCZ-1]|uniref:DUF11 domain-containing protein n=1 Tax=Variovorax sp. PCZ-1 TaxID=2835533 RepID=UPI001BCC66D1|nr:DUF11 domain-containing protein [Variovorax sp. PCZ-1]MBS7807804.1 DUF11 domain-containing protein [Variovorax sp. PCZ-1]